MQSADGDSISVIQTADALDTTLAGCNRKGLREKALLNALKRDHARLRDQLQAGRAAAVSSPPWDSQAIGGVNRPDKDAIQAILLIARSSTYVSIACSNTCTLQRLNQVCTVRVSDRCRD